QSAALNNVGYKKSYLSYFDITKGGALNFIMGAKASSFGATDYPSTAITDNLIVLNPIIDGGAVSFVNEKEVKIYSNQPIADIYYTVDGTVPTGLSKKYTSAFTINASATIKAIAISDLGKSSLITTANYIKRTNQWGIQLKSSFEPQYEAGGAEGLIDGIVGSANWRKGNWMGFQKTDIEVVIDLKETKTISNVTMGFLQDTRAWVVAPRKITIEVSTDGNEFMQVYSGENFLAIDDLNVQVKRIKASFAPVNAKYVKIKAIQYGKLPSWHEGAGGDTHLFTDEIDIK
ncbi:MAG: chitobiase/beta-hexosaminidase C-terminal domain-containing protein, partial [Ferruginibacter sp.]